MKIDASSPALHYSLGNALYESGHAKEATAELQRSIELDPGFFKAHLALGVLAHSQGDRDSALREWQKAAQLNPSSDVALDWIAKARIEAGQYTAALDILRTAPHLRIWLSTRSSPPVRRDSTKRASLPD